jgi:hypothetical protein
MANPFPNPINAKAMAKKSDYPGDLKNTHYDERNRYPAGDYYGTGVRAKVGKLRGASAAGHAVPQKDLCTDPLSLP